MLQFDNTTLTSLSVHQVGNKTYEEGLDFSQSPVDIGEEGLVRLMKIYFLNSFSGNEMFHFKNEVGLEQNEIYMLAAKLFKDPDQLYELSKTIALHLYNSTTHPKVKGGELYIAYLKDVLLDDELTDCIGIFKSETKEDYLKVNVKNTDDQINYDEGININKLDKGCLIFNVDKAKGYQLCIIDNLNKSTEAAYWKDDFLSIQPITNDFYQTNQFLGLAKQFVTKQMAEDFEVTKADQIDLLNRSVDYFKKNDDFNKDDFENEVFGDSNVRESFRKFDESYREAHDVEISDTFSISIPALKKQAAAFKSVLKLDKNFHIYIHGDKELIEQGMDESGRKYYKIYYEQES